MVTKEMICAAHDICLKKGDFVLSASLLERIYLAMRDKADGRDSAGWDAHEDLRKASDEMVLNLRQRVQELEKQRDDFRRDAAEFSGQVSRLVDHNNNLVNHREELILEITRIKRGDFSNERIENDSLKLCINVQNEQIESLREQRDELLAELQRFMDSHEECTDFDGFTAQIVSMADYHQAQEAIESLKGEQ